MHIINLYRLHQLYKLNDAGVKYKGKALAGFSDHFELYGFYKSKFKYNSLIPEDFEQFKSAIFL